MKKASLYPHVFLAMLGFLVPGQGSAAPLATDSFATTTDGSGGTYNSTLNADARIYGQNPTAYNSGFDAAWGNSNNTATGNIRLELNGLTHPLMQGTAVAGDVWLQRNNLGRSTTRSFASSVDTAIANQLNTNGEIWFSGLTSFGSVNAGGIFFGLGGNLASGEAPSSGIQVYSGSGQIRLFNGGTQLGSFSISAGVTYLVAVKIDFGAGATDSVTVEIYNSTATVGNPTSTITASNLDLTTANLEYLVMHQNSTSAYTLDANTPRFDEFRLGLQRSDVMAVPEPSSLALIAMGLAVVLNRWPRRRTV